MTTETVRDSTNDLHWREFTHEWLIRSDTTYLNHGSFGPPSNYVRQRRRVWIDKLDEQPMDFFLRQLEPELIRTRSEVADFVGTASDNLTLVENATFGMNIVAESFLNSGSLQAGDEVLINDHEYGVVKLIWERACQRVGAELKIAQLPERFESKEQIVDCLLSAASPKTKLVAVSHITSPTALIMPVNEICTAFRERGVTTVVDGPHAPAQLDLNVDKIGCDFYTASCHKWLCATLGTGFLCVDPKWHDQIVPQVQSWGRMRPAMPEKWFENFYWCGTRDPSAYLSISDAIHLMTNKIGLEAFRGRSRYLAGYAEQVLCDEFKTTPIGIRKDGWYASMAHVPLPAGDYSSLQAELWNESGIEVIVKNFNDKWYVRVSSHLYNSTKQIEALKFAIQKFRV